MSRHTAPRTSIPNRSIAASSFCPARLTKRGRCRTSRIVALGGSCRLPPVTHSPPRHDHGLRLPPGLDEAPLDKELVQPSACQSDSVGIVSW